ncbi:MAG: hypothetical protein HGA45_44750, partial [Chloroflexales bacterium]|nr:hypothetical protein [Chloroflexales bacterium]
ATQLQGGLVVRSGSDAAGSVGLSVTQGATQLQGGLTANGGSTLTGGTTIGGDLTVNGSAMMNGNVTLGTAGGSAQITVHGMTVIRGSQGHLQLRRTANTTGVATMALELYQEDVPNVTDSPTPLSIRFQHASIYSHRIEASTNGFSFMAGDLNNSTPSNIQAATVTAARFLGPGSCPTGTILMWAGALSAVPTGWQLCNGQSLSRTEYAGLFGVIGMTYGADNSATFRVPNLLERFVVGANNFTYPVGATGGQAMVTLTVNQMPSHNHQAGGHSYLLAKTRSGTIKEADTFGDEPDLTSAYPIQPAGGDQAHENRPPYLALAFIIKS